METDLTYFDNEKLNLEILGEEAAETSEAAILMLTDTIQSLAQVGRIKSKIIRFGLDNFHPKNKVPNNLKLEEELGHVMAMADILVANGTITMDGILKGRQEKFKNLVSYYEPKGGNDASDQ